MLLRLHHLPEGVITFCAADSIPCVIFIAVSKVRTGSESWRHWMYESFTPHTNQLHYAIPRDVPYLQNSTRAFNSDTNVEIDSPCCLNQLKNLCHSTISDGFGLWCFFIASTKPVYDLSSNHSGETKLRSSMYALGPMTVWRTALFLLVSTMLLAVKKFSNLSKH